MADHVGRATDCAHFGGMKLSHVGWVTCYPRLLAGKNVGNKLPTLRVLSKQHKVRTCLTAQSRVFRIVCQQ